MPRLILLTWLKKQGIDDALIRDMQVGNRLKYTLN